MSRFGGASSAEIGAPAVVCFEMVCDTPRTPEWQEAVAAVEVLERDRDGRTQASFQTEFDPGPVLSLLAKGPLFARLETLLTQQPPEGLKQAVETRS